MHRTDLPVLLGLAPAHEPETHAPNAPSQSRHRSFPDVEYQPDLSADALIAEIRALLERQRVLERLMCRYLADLADRITARREIDPFGGYLDVYEAAEHLLGLDVRRTRERVRVGRALRSLPQIEQAFERGRISYTRVREITRIARPESEALWLELGMTLPMRQLERRVIAAGRHALEKEDALERAVTRSSHSSRDEKAPRRVATPSHPSEKKGAWSSSPCAFAVTAAPHPLEQPAKHPDPSGKVRLVFDLTANGALVVQRALAAVRNRNDAALTDAEALIALARGTMRRHENGGPIDSGVDEATPARSHHAVVDLATLTGSRDAADAAPLAGSRDVGDAAPLAGSRDVGDAAPLAGSRDVGTEEARPARWHDAAVEEATLAGSRDAADEGPLAGACEAVREAPPAGLRRWRCDEKEETASHGAMILCLMVSRRRWNADELHEATGLSIPAVCVALSRLEIEAMIRRDLAGYYLPYAA